MNDNLDADKIREAGSLRAEELNLTAYAISKQLGGVPTQESVKRYLSRRSSLSTKYVSRICDILGLAIKPKEEA